MTKEIDPEFEKYANGTVLHMADSTVLASLASCITSIRANEEAKDRWTKIVNDNMLNCHAKNVAIALIEDTPLKDEFEKNLLQTMKDYIKQHKLLK